MTVVVATADFEVYYGVVGELRRRDVAFTTIEPEEGLPEETTVVITGADDSVASGPSIDQVIADPNTPRRAVEKALAVGRGSARRIVGVDPGERPGIAVLDGEDVVAAFQVPLADAADVIRREVTDAIDPVVRIGDGARLHGAGLIDDLEDVRVELVDETGSTPHLGAGARGMGDVIAATNIARRKGEPIQRREIEPTAGELQTIKTAARERSSDNRAIPAELARRVAAGELTIEDALVHHRRQD